MRSAPRHLIVLIWLCAIAGAGGVAWVCPVVAADTESLQIISAKWGSGGKQLDVTEKVKSLVKDDRLEVWASSKTMGGDPASGWVKTLVVTYEQGGKRHSRSAREGSKLTIGKESPSTSSTTAPTTSVVVSTDSHSAHSTPMWDSENGANSIALTPDGKYLLAAFQAKDQVKVFDVHAWKDVTTIKCDAPRFILCRGQSAYIASFGHGKIECFDAKTWSLQNEVLSGAANVAYLSAPAGSAFKDRLIASHHAGKPSGDQISCFLVDLKKDTHQLLEKTILPTCSMDGTLVIDQQWNDDDVYEFGESIGDKRCSKRGDESTLFQSRPGPFWYDGLALYILSGETFDELRRDFTKLLVPDQSRPVFYGLNDDEIIVYRESNTLDTLGKIPLVYDAAADAQQKKNSPANSRGSAKKEKVEAILPDRWRIREADYDTPLGVTLDGMTSLFYIDNHHVVRAIHVPAIAPEVLAAPGTPAAADSKTAGGFPDQVRVGKPFTLKLPAAPGVTRALVNPPGNMKISENGTLTWTPSAAEAGTQTIKMRIEQGGKVSFERHDVLVSENAVASAQGGGGAAAGGESQPIPLSGENYNITLSADGRSVLILAGDQLSQTDATGVHVVSTVTLPRQYIRFVERATYDVALSNNTLDLLDKTTHHVTKSIELGSPKAYDLAIRPKVKTSYVSLHRDHGGNEPDEVARRVCEIDETTGTVREIPNAVGQWIAVDPAGRHLYVALHFLYEDGVVLDFNLGETRPEYGNIDTLMTFELGDGAVTRRGVNLNAGTNGHNLRVAPDGSSVAYVSAAGKPIYSYAVPAFDPADPNRVLASYSMKDHGFPADIAYHNALPWVAVVSNETAQIFNRTTGDLMDKKLDLGRKPIKDAEHCLFSPDGLSLLVDTDTPKGRQWIAYPLRLSDDEMKKATAGPAHTPPVEKNAPPAKPAPASDKKGLPSAMLDFRSGLPDFFTSVPFFR